MNAHPEQSAASLAVPEPTTAGIGARLIARISCASDSGIDIRRLKHLLFIGLVTIALFEVASRVFPILSEPSRTPDPIAFQIFNLFLVCVSALGLPWIGRNWRWWTLSFCVVLMLSETVAGILVSENDPVMMMLFVLIVTSAMFVPWEARWQGSLGFLAVGAFIANAIGGVAEENDPQQWLSLTVLMAFAMSFAALKDYYRRQLVVDLEKSRAAALSSARAKSEFLSSVSHEIRKPMNAILGMSELLEETELSSDQRHYLEIMTANGNALLELINIVLDLARIESGRMQIEKIEFNLPDLIDQTISTFGLSAHGKGLELAAHVPPVSLINCWATHCGCARFWSTSWATRSNSPKWARSCLKSRMRRRKSPALCSLP
jgi:signal transduction histidine kinase